MRSSTLMPIHRHGEGIQGVNSSCGVERKCVIGRSQGWMQGQGLRQTLSVLRGTPEESISYRWLCARFRKSVVRWQVCSEEMKSQHSSSLPKTVAKDIPNYSCASERIRSIRPGVAVLPTQGGFQNNN